MAYVSRMSKMLWGEGLFLRPQHFQRQDAYHEARLQDLSQTLHPYGWGVRSVRFDTSALASGVLRPLELSVVFPDGESFDAPTHDELPDALSLQDLAPGTQSTLVHLALPLLRENGSNLAVGGDSSPARYRQRAHETTDLFTDAAAAELAYLGKAAQLLVDTQPRDNHSTVPVIRVRRTSSGGFEVDPEFVPACVRLQSSPCLLRELRSLLDAMQAKVDALYGHHRHTSQNIIEFRAGDIASFWLLHTLNSSFGALAHLLQHPLLHPERLHQELLRTAAALLTFSNTQQLSDLPPYDHEAPEAPFHAVLDMIRLLLETVISTRYVQIALEEIKPSYHLGRIDSQRIDGEAALYLSVSAAIPAEELLQSVPSRFKMGSPDDVERCVLSALPGIRLSHAPQVPAAVPVRPGNHYFELDARGVLYERMLKTQSLMVYVPAGIPGLELELIAVTA